MHGFDLKYRPVAKCEDCPCCFDETGECRLDMVIDDAVDSSGTNYVGKDGERFWGSEKCQMAKIVFMEDFSYSWYPTRVMAILLSEVPLHQGPLTRTQMHKHCRILYSNDFDYQRGRSWLLEEELCMDLI